MIFCPTLGLLPLVILGFPKLYAPVEAVCERAKERESVRERVRVRIRARVRDRFRERESEKENIHLVVRQINKLAANKLTLTVIPVKQYTV